MAQVIGIIADDLTGANDSGVQLKEKGIDTSVLFDVPEQQENVDKGIVIDTNSRALNREDAYAVTKKAANFLKKSGYQHIYKKMDSTLRGHIGTELEAVREVFKPEFVIIAPAFPPYGRTTVDGHHYVKGVKISETEISQDPKHPVKESYIPAIIEEEIGAPVGLIKSADLRKSFVSWVDKIKQFRAEQVHYIVCDAETQADLQAIVERMVLVTNNIIWAGSAGLAEVLPLVLKLGDQPSETTIPHSEQVMTVCGSLSEVTQQQVHYAKDQENVAPIEVDTMQIFSDNWQLHAERYVQKTGSALKEGKDIVLYVPSNQQVREQVKQLGQELGLSKNQIGERISEAIGQIVAKVSEQNQNLRGFFLTGGDTAKETARHLGAVGFRLIKQIEAGIPVGTLIGTNREITAVTKAGAFGKTESIYRAMQELKGVLHDEQEANRRYNYG
ncbi:four-carbon acid sugar kinase family protein [Virgibacillus senegalensis]|uniref:four-carbon acid sugar kinase family protein n=1 Tax=Virgibacillus senegalensis TaxID=1499679 RepID=UPI00069D286F|nr:four-carbon acid sugar kinase family protein [Virgibacillus senegalensis]